MLDKDRELLKQILERLDRILAILEQRQTVTPARWPLEGEWIDVEWVSPPVEGEWIVPDTTAGLMQLMGGTFERR